MMHLMSNVILNIVLVWRKKTENVEIIFSKTVQEGMVHTDLLVLVMVATPLMMITDTEGSGVTSFTLILA